MKKHLLIWVGLTLFIGFGFFNFAQMLSNTRVHALSFTDALLLIGFSTVLSTLSICMRMIMEKN